MGWLLGVDGSAGAFVEAQGLHDGEGSDRGEYLDVGGGEHAGVFGDDGRGGAFGDGVEVGFDPGPGVFPVVHVVRPVPAEPRAAPGS